MTEELYDVDDSPYRKCYSCDLSHHEENGSSCDECDEWYCADCYADEDHTRLHQEK